MGINQSKPVDDQAAAVDGQKMDTSAEKLNRTPTPGDLAVDKEPVLAVSPLDAFHEELEQKITDLQRQKKTWVEQLTVIMSDYSTELPRAHEGYQQFLKELDPTRLDYTQPVSQWFKDHILNAVTLEIEPANFALDQFVAEFQTQVAPLNKKLSEAEDNLVKWNQNKAEGIIVEPIFKGQICSYAIQMIDIELALIDTIKTHIDHCIGWENTSVKILTLLLEALNMSTIHLVLPNFDFTPVIDRAYKTALNQEIAPEESAIEKLMAETDAVLAHAKGFATPAKVVSPKKAPSPKPTQSPEQIVTLDESAKSALLDTAGQFTRRTSPKPARVIAAPAPKHPPTSPRYQV